MDARACSDPVVVWREPHAYSSHPSIARLPSGDWLVAFCQSIDRPPPFVHPPNDPRFLAYVTRSADRGRTWTAPAVVPGYDWFGVETPGIAALSTGEVLVNQWRFHWLPAPEARRRWDRGDRSWYVVDATTRAWRPAERPADWIEHPLPYARADDGAYVHISLDGGRTWAETVRIEIAPYRGAFSPKGVVELATDDLLLALGSHEHDPLGATFVVRSRDRGRSWGAPIEVARRPGLVFSEPSLVMASSGRLLLFSREERTGRIHRSVSLDRGTTWSGPEPLPVWGYPPHAIRLADGRLVVAYGHRRPPFGIRLIVSEDEGETWGPEVVIRDDLPGTNEGLNLGYPSVLEDEPGRLFVVYYAEDAAGVTGIEGTFVELG